MIAWVVITLLALDLTAVERQPPDTVAEPIRNVLDPKAYQIKDADGERMTIWLRQTIPVKATADQIKNGLTCRELTETAVVGVVMFKAAFIDYRKQTIPAGCYTLRVAFQPETADHKETAPHAEFLLLTPVADDRSLEEIDVKTLIERSRKATGGDHPGVMLLNPFSGDKADARLVEMEKAGTVLMLKRSMDANGKEGTIGFGLTIAGSSEKR
jgi:hypothetical protein